MSSKRGRKRNDNLPPNRARDVQRAFRARRAAHLDALEQRVAELEEENGNFRATLNHPPADRLPLGKLGKDNLEPRQPLALPPSRPSRGRTGFSFDSDSPTSTRARSLSPSFITQAATMHLSTSAVHASSPSTGHPPSDSPDLPMSSKRGRKRNDNLPPNRARDVRRAFRARRAAHLDALEQRVAELGEENGNLRAALNLPPAKRLPLGNPVEGKSHATNNPGSSSDSDSPTSTRARSLSPSTTTATMRPSPNAVHSLEGGSWDQGMIIGEERNQSTGPHASLPSTGYPLSSVTPHSKNPLQFSYSGPAQSSSRTTLPGTMYIPTVPQGTQHFFHSADRPLGEYGSSYPVRGSREDQQCFPYFQPSYSGPEKTHLSQHVTSLHYSSQQACDPSPAQTPVPFAHRHSITDPQGFSSLVNQYPHLPPPTSLRRLSPPRLSESSHSVRPSFNGGGS